MEPLETKVVVTVPLLDSSNFDFNCYDEQNSPIDLGSVKCTKYKLYTDANNLCLYMTFTSPFGLLNVASLPKASKGQLVFLSDEEDFITGYQFGIEAFSWEIEGEVGNKKPASWSIVLILDNETIEVINKPKDDSNKN